MTMISLGGLPPKNSFQSTGWFLDLLEAVPFADEAAVEDGAGYGAAAVVAVVAVVAVRDGGG